MIRSKSSTAPSKEASGTGNMKFSLNGANVGIREEVGAENFFLFGLTAAEVEVKSRGYRPRDHYEQSATLREVIDFTASGALGRGDAELFRPLVENLLDYDPFLLLADYHAYIDAQDRVSALWREPHAWRWMCRVTSLAFWRLTARQSILNSARMGKFSSDRSIRDYCENVWKVQPASVAS